MDQVVAGTGCFDRERIRRMLEQCGGSVEQAIELLIEQLGQEEPEEAEGGGQEGAAANAQQHAVQGVEQQQAAPAAAVDVQQAGGSAGAVERTQQAAAAAAEQQQQQQQLGDDSIRLELRPRPGDPSCIQAVLTLAEAGRQQAAGQQQATGETAGGAAADEPDSSDKRGGQRGTKGIRVKHKPEHPGRNQKCSCGSGKKVKNCCGAMRSKRGAAAIGRSAEADDGDSGAAAAAAQLQVLHI